MFQERHGWERPGWFLPRGKAEVMFYRGFSLDCIQNFLCITKDLHVRSYLDV